MAVAPSFKPLAMAELRLTTTMTLSLVSKPSFLSLVPSSKPFRLVRLSFSQIPPPFVSLVENKQKKLLLVPLVASQASGWARQEEEESDIQDRDLDWSGEEEEAGPEAGLSEWEGEGDEGEEDLQVAAVSKVAVEAEAGFGEEGEEESYPEPPEEAKLFVGNIPYDMDSEKLAQLFEKAGVVEVAEVIYNRETDQSRGFGFVTMSTVEEAEKAVEMFHRYEINDRFFTVNKASPRGARVQRTFEPAYRIYVGNLPWSVNDARLMQIFSEHGKVKDARVVCDRDSGRSRGFGFVVMASQIEMDDAIAALDGQSLDGRALRVNVAEERPRRSSF